MFPTKMQTNEWAGPAGDSCADRQPGCLFTYFEIGFHVDQSCLKLAI